MTRLSDMLIYLRKREGLSQKELADILKVSRSAIGMYETGKREPDLETLEAIADYYNVDMNTLTGQRNPAPALPANLRPVKKVHYIPRVGRIACGTPILAEENIQGYVLLPDGVKADFALNCAGDSMIDASINDGDTVFIRKQPEVENGEIAAVLIGEEATLKRVYWNGNVLTLMPANKDFAPLTYAGEEMESVSILGKATAVLKL